MKKFLRLGFLPKLLTALLLLAELGLLLWGLVLLTSEALSHEVIFWLLVPVYILNVIASVSILNGGAPDVYKIAWLIVVNCVPLLGLIAYILFANKQTDRQRHKSFLRWSEHLQRLPTPPELREEMKGASPLFRPVSDYVTYGSGLGAYKETKVTYYPSGEAVFPVMLEELRKAKHYIFIEYFIIETPSKFWDSILEILEEKAKEGVDVRLIYDDVGSISTLPYNYDAIMRRKGIKCEVYEPFRPFLDVRLNNRDHRKILVIDGHTCFSGGLNIADEYINEKVRFGYWKDNSVMLKGRAVHSFTLMFLANWMAVAELDGEIDLEYYRPKTYIDEVGGFPESDGYVQPYCDLPYDAEAVGENAYIHMLSQARESVDIVTPYLVITKEMEHAIVNAAHRGCRVRVLTPHVPDKKTVFHLTRSYYGNLLKAGVEVYEYNPGFVHEKVFVIDNKMATVGTINLDYRSLYLHLECGTLLMGCSCIDDIAADFEDSVANSQLITLERWEGWHKRNLTYWGMLRLVATFL